MNFELCPTYLLDFMSLLLGDKDHFSEPFIASMEAIEISLFFGGNFEKTWEDLNLGLTKSQFRQVRHILWLFTYQIKLLCNYQSSYSLWCKWNWFIFRHLLRRNCGRLLGIAWSMYPDEYTKIWYAECLERSFPQIEKHEQFLLEKWYYEISEQTNRKFSHGKSLQDIRNILNNAKQGDVQAIGPIGKPSMAAWYANIKENEGKTYNILCNTLQSWLTFDRVGKTALFIAQEGKRVD